MSSHVGAADETADDVGVEETGSGFDTGRDETIPEPEVFSGEELLATVLHPTSNSPARRMQRNFFIERAPS